MDIQLAMEKLHSALGGKTHVGLLKADDLDGKGKWIVTGGRLTTRPQDNAADALIQMAQLIEESTLATATEAGAVADQAKALVKEIDAALAA